MFWLTQSEVDSVERQHYDEILRCSFQKSREIVWFSITTTKKKFNLLRSARWHAHLHLSVVTIKAFSL